MHAPRTVASAAVALTTFETSDPDDRTNGSPAVDLPMAAPLGPATFNVEKNLTKPFAGTHSGSRHPTLDIQLTTPMTPDDGSTERHAAPPLGPCSSHPDARSSREPNTIPLAEATTGPRHPALDIRAAASASATHLPERADLTVSLSPEPCSSRPDDRPTLEASPDLLAKATTSSRLATSNSRHPDRGADAAEPWLVVS